MTPLNDFLFFLFYLLLFFQVCVHNHYIMLCTVLGVLIYLYNNAIRESKTLSDITECFSHYCINPLIYILYIQLCIEFKCLWKGVLALCVNLWVFMLDVLDIYIKKMATRKNSFCLLCMTGDSYTFLYLYTCIVHIANYLI